ncbi:hypothetical protein NCAS_0C05120 [Naumovozyma castellii]|uniref:Uncharacterized protein n=1 Tax=Naumovozyma castellii TaxID=27288 RepID=G0VDE0_NAUCA|nr:hypothetical protein NCAS_0C05120 [Naumovozyma castellii CBS 4309]CCC69502.1 hypothetical protein NCAS_0C05120 [Naumovozyma castellii CBS 4309]
MRRIKKRLQSPSISSQDTEFSLNAAFNVAYDEMLQENYQKTYHHIRRWKNKSNSAPKLSQNNKAYTGDFYLNEETEVENPGKPLKPLKNHHNKFRFFKKMQQASKRSFSKQENGSKENTFIVKKENIDPLSSRDCSSQWEKTLQFYTQGEKQYSSFSIISQDTLQNSFKIANEPEQFHHIYDHMVPFKPFDGFQNGIDEMPNPWVSDTKENDEVETLYGKWGNCYL